MPFPRSVHHLVSGSLAPSALSLSSGLPGTAGGHAQQVARWGRESGRKAGPCLHSLCSWHRTWVGHMEPSLAEHSLCSRLCPRVLLALRAALWDCGCPTVQLPDRVLVGSAACREGTELGSGPRCLACSAVPGIERGHEPGCRPDWLCHPT